MGKHSNTRPRSSSGSNKPIANFEDTGNSNSISLCNVIKKLVNEAVSVWKAEYINEIEALKRKLIVVTKSQEFMNLKYEELKTEYNNLVKCSKAQADKIDRLKTQSTKLEVSAVQEKEKIDALEQYGRKQNLEIVGVPYKQGENTNKIVIEVAKLLNAELMQD